MIVIEDVYKIKRGIVLCIDNPKPVPQMGETYSCGNDSWKIIGVEKAHNGCFGAADKQSYLFVVLPVSNSKMPVAGYVLDRVE